jgi:hypothetical protein
LRRTLNLASVIPGTDKTIENGMTDCFKLLSCSLIVFYSPFCKLIYFWTFRSQDMHHSETICIVISLFWLVILFRYDSQEMIVYLICRWFSQLLLYRSLEKVS